jgi:hypothetical protein
MKSWMLKVLALAAFCGLVSCGGYSRDFARAVEEMPRPPANAEGPWLGSWKSDVNGHTGPLWCVVTPNAAKPGSFDFRYRAGWGMLKFGDYIHTVEAKMAADGSIRLVGEMELPGGMGVYQVDGRLTKETFEATFQSKGDRGTMTLKRPAER